MGYCVPSIAHITFGNLAVKSKSTLILSAACGKPMCCSCRCAVSLSTPDSTRLSVTSLLYVPPSAEKTPRPRDEESAKVWPARGCHDSSWSVILNQSRTAWLGNVYLLFTSSFTWNEVKEIFPLCEHDRRHFTVKKKKKKKSASNNLFRCPFTAKVHLTTERIFLN